MGRPGIVPGGVVIRVVLADDQPVVRAGLRMIFEAHDDVEIVVEADDGQEAVALVRDLEPDVVLMDIRMPQLDGIEAARRITASQLSTRVIVLTTYGVDENVYAALKAGATGFLLKTDHPDYLVHAVRTAASGTALLGPETTTRLIERFLAAPPSDVGPPPELARLTGREREVLLELARGKSNAEIAHDLYVGEGTVKTHVARILAKLDLRDRVQAVVFSYEHGLVRPSGR